MQDAKVSCGKVSSAWLISQGLEIPLFFCSDQSQLGRRVKFSPFVWLESQRNVLAGI